ncbi:hypothetical protein LCGC14_0582230 [marine sediment metagenome]|uniref:Uncharacterized protein n=1 Tax=marine sediment metagenome TaxID=412755 RepID=A0A0F9UPA9_9ZZZZ
MSKRTDSHTVSHAESIYSGDAYQAGAEGNGRGIPRASLVQVDLGTPALAVAAGIGAQDSGAGGPYPFSLTIDGSLATGGVATFDVPRGVQVVSGGADTGTAVFVFYGTDKYGVLIQESVTSNGTTIVKGLKAFKTITQVTVSADTTASYNFGSSGVLGLPFRLENVADVLVVDENDSLLFGRVAKTAATVAGATAGAPAVTASSPAQTQVTVTDALNGATFTGTALTTSTVATADENETNFGVVGLQLNAAQTDIADNKSSIDELIADDVATLAELAKLLTDVNLIRVEVDKLVVDAAAIDTGTLVKADATATSTATTGDVRGTYDPTMALDGSKTLKLTYKPKGRNTRGAYGSVQYRA